MSHHQDMFGCLQAGWLFVLCCQVLYLLIPCSTFLLDKLTGLQLVKKFPAFYGNRTFIAAFTIALSGITGTKMFSSHNTGTIWHGNVQDRKPHI